MKAKLKAAAQFTGLFKEAEAKYESPVKPKRSSDGLSSRQRNFQTDAPFELAWCQENLNAQGIKPRALTTDYSWVLDPKNCVVAETEKERKKAQMEAKNSQEAEEEDPFGATPANYTESKWFALLIASAICVNAIQMGVEVDNPEYTTAYLALENIFALIFSFEMVSKLYFQRLQYFKVSWNVLDFFLVLLSIFDLWIMQLVAESGTNTKKLSGLRMLRILRVARMVRLLKVFKELWLIIKGIIDSVQTIFWAGALVVMIIYVFAILFVKVIASHEGYADLDYVAGVDTVDYHPDFDAAQYYGNVLRSMYTNFETTMEPLNLRPVIEKQPEMFLFYLGFIFIATFGVMNVIVGVIVESTMEAALAQNKEQECKLTLSKLANVERIQDACRLLDVNGDGVISLDEIHQNLSTDELTRYFKDLELPLGAGADEIYDLLNPGGQGSVTHLDVMKHLIRCIAVDPDSIVVDLQSGYRRLVSNCRASVEFPAEIMLHNNRKIDRINGIVANYKERLQQVGEVVKHLGETIPQRTQGRVHDPMFSRPVPAHDSASQVHGSSPNDMSTEMPDSHDDGAPGIRLSHTQDVLASGRTKVKRPEARSGAASEVSRHAPMKSPFQDGTSLPPPPGGPSPSGPQEAREAVPKLNLHQLPLY